MAKRVSRDVVQNVVREPASRKGAGRMGNRPLDCYLPKDLQDYVSLLQYLPLEYTQEGENHEMLVQMSTSHATIALDFPADD